MLRSSVAVLIFALSSHAAFAEIAVAVPADKPDPNAYVEPTRAEKLEACMQTWEEAVHISKKRWREMCIEREHAK